MSSEEEDAFQNFWARQHQLCAWLYYFLQYNKELTLCLTYYSHPSADIMVTTSLAWVRLTRAALAMRHSLLFSGSCSRHATTWTGGHCL